MAKNEEIKKQTGGGGPTELEDDSSISESEETITAEWTGKLLKARPEIVQMRERSRPLIGETSYGRKIGSATTESPLVLSHRTVGQLLLGYLQEKGFQKSLEKIEIETGFKLQKNMIREDGKLLEKMLHTGISDVATLFDPALSSLDEEGGMGEGEVGWFDYQPSTYDDQDNNEEDINIWDTPKDKEIVLEPSAADKKVSVVVLCTFNSIVQFITSSNPGNTPMRDAFLTTYRSYTTPDKLFDKLLQRYEVTGELVLDDPEYVKQIRLRVVVVLKFWMANHPRDFSDRLLSKVREFTENRLIKDGHQEFSKSLTNTLSKLAEGGGWGYEAVFDLCPDPKVPKNIFSPTLKLDDIPKLEIARQMTLIDYHLFASISSVEFCNKNWTKVKNSRSSPLIAMINRFNEIVKWVTTSILSEKRYKNRAKIIQNYLEIAVSLQGLQNFHSLAAIFTGITHGSVFRLKHTFNELSPMARKNISSISSFLSPNESYKQYKSFISFAKPPAIPHIAVNLQDLCFIDEIVPDMVSGKINFRKHRIIYNLISQDIRRFQRIGYNFLSILQISSLLKGFTNLIKDEGDLYKCSLVLEPKGISAIDLVDYEEQLNSSSPSV